MKRNNTETRKLDLLNQQAKRTIMKQGCLKFMTLIHLYSVHCALFTHPIPLLLTLLFLSLPPLLLQASLMENYPPVCSLYKYTILMCVHCMVLLSLCIFTV